MNVTAYNDIQIEALKLALRKNADYSGSKVDNLAITGVYGIAVRLMDKVSRIYNLASGAESQIKSESMRDTFIDIINYATFAVVMLDGHWKSLDQSPGVHLEETIGRMQLSRKALIDRTIGDNNG